jgi:hypothetical protein
MQYPVFPGMMATVAVVSAAARIGTVSSTSTHFTRVPWASMSMFALGPGAGEI